MNDIYENIEQYNPYKERKILNVFNDMSTGMLSDNKKKSRNSSTNIC